MTNELLSAYLDGELSETERAEVDAALQASPTLRADLDGLEQTRTLLRSMGEVTPGPGVLDPAVVSLDSHRRRRRTARWLAPAATVVGVAAVWLLVLGVFSGTSVARIVPAVDQYVDRHAAALEIGESDGFVAVDPALMPDDMPPMLDEVTGLAMTGAFERDDVIQALYSDGEHELSVYREPGRVDWDELAAEGRGATERVDDDTRWRYEANGMSIMVVERNDHVVTIVADPGMDTMMVKAANA